MTARVDIERRGPVATLRYDNGLGNVLCVEGLIAMRRALAAVTTDDAVRVVVLAGRPDGFVGPFEPDEALSMARAQPRWPGPVQPLVSAIAPAVAALLDRLDLLPERPSWHAHTGYLHHLRLFEAVERCRAITVASIEGHCVGGGLELALCTDLRVVRDADGLVFAQPEILADLVPGFGGTQRLARAVGVDRALALQLTGDTVAPADALRIGLVHRVLPDAGYDRVLGALTDRLARRAPAAVQGIKRATRLADARALAAALAVERREVMRAWSRPEAAQGLTRLSALLADARERGGADAVALLRALDEPAVGTAG